MIVLASHYPLIYFHLFCAITSSVLREKKREKVGNPLVSLSTYR